PLEDSSTNVALQCHVRSAADAKPIKRSSIDGSGTRTPTLKKNGQRKSRTDFRGRSQFSPGSDTAPDLGPQGLPTFDSHDRPTSYPEDIRRDRFVRHAFLLPSGQRLS